MEKSVVRLDYKRTFLVGFGFFGISILWTLYNAYVPIFLQVNINSLPMVVDIAASDADLGTYTGLYYIASQLAAVAGPTINGYIVEWGGGNYNLIFLVTPAFFLLAILCMMGGDTGRGEMRRQLLTISGT